MKKDKMVWLTKDSLEKVDRIGPGVEEFNR